MPSQNKKVVVTGAAGFIGSHLAEKLHSQKISVIGVDNLDPYYDINQKKSNLEHVKKTAEKNGATFQFVQKDLCDLTQKDIDFESVSRVYHLAAKAGVSPSLKDPVAYLRANVEGTANLLKLCVENEVKEVCFASSSSVYGDSSPIPFKETVHIEKLVSPYAVSKRAGELLCETFAKLYGMKIASLRIFTAFGPRQRPDLAIHHFVNQILNENEIILYGDGTTYRDYTFVSDLVSGILSAGAWLEGVKDGTHDVFNLGSGRPVTLAELILDLEAVLKVKANIKHEAFRLGDVSRTYADISKSQKVLGFRPQTTLAEGLYQFIQWHSLATLITPKSNRKVA